MGLSKPKNVTIEGGGMEMVKLWRNASPNSAFAPQTIALPLSDYTMFMIEFAERTDYGCDICCFYTRSMSTFNATCTVDGQMYTRTGKSSATGIEFYACNHVKTYADYASTTDNGMIPYAIYGIKGVEL